jgi:hypothetical protein
MGEAPESGGEIEGHRESLRGRHLLLHQGERTRRLAKEDVVAFLAYLMDTGSASPWEKLLREGRTKPCNQREWAIFVAEPTGKQGSTG